VTGSIELGRENVSIELAAPSFADHSQLSQSLSYWSSMLWWFML